jgi:hypothetical protein
MSMSRIHTRMAKSSDIFATIRKLSNAVPKNYGTRKTLPEYGSFTLLPDVKPFTST